MIQFIYHPSICEEIDAVENKFSTIRDGFKSFEKLCGFQFNPAKPQQVIAPGKLHRIVQNDIWTMWKVELVVANVGLRPNQYPRVWFAVKGDVIVFLCMGTHMENYNDEEMNRIATSRVTDFF